MSVTLWDPDEGSVRVGTLPLLTIIRSVLFKYFPVQSLLALVFADANIRRY